jgi:hypothetical protein
VATKSKSLAAFHKPRPAAFLLSAASPISLFAAHANARGALSAYAFLPLVIYSSHRELILLIVDDRAVAII